MRLGTETHSYSLLGLIRSPRNSSVRRTAVQTIKTAVVVVLLLFVLYGSYVALNGTDTPLKEGLEELIPPGDLNANFEGPAARPMNGTSTAGGSADAFNQFISTPVPSFAPAAPSSNGKSSADSPAIPDLDAPEFNVPRPSGSSNAPMIPGTLAPLPSNSPASPASPNAPRAENKEPGFGLAVPDAKPTEATLLPKSSLSAGGVSPPNLDLRSIHGDAKTMGDVTKQRLNEETVNNASVPLPNSKPGRSFENAKQLAMQQIEKRSLRDALATLSVFYSAQELTTEQRADLFNLLDALAREVIYSRSHLMEFQYVPAPSESLEQIAKRYSVPREILARINGLDGADEPQAGTHLKVIQGPFRAEVDLSRNELTLFLGELYAGRYPAAFGSEPQPRPGIYEVADKQRNKNYYSANGMQISSDDPKNPYGGFWIDLGQDVSIHGSPELDNGGTNPGCISLSPLDASDVFGMLGRGSQVTIRQ